jgi:hypothetical protein
LLPYCVTLLATIDQLTVAALVIIGLVARLVLATGLTSARLPGRDGMSLCEAQLIGDVGRGGRPSSRLPWPAAIWMADDPCLKLGAQGRSSARLADHLVKVSLEIGDRGRPCSFIRTV